MMAVMTRSVTACPFLGRRPPSAAGMLRPTRGDGQKGRAPPSGGFGSSTAGGAPLSVGVRVDASGADQAGRVMLSRHDLVEGNPVITRAPHCGGVDVTEQSREVGGLEPFEAVVGTKQIDVTLDG